MRLTFLTAGLLFLAGIVFWGGFNTAMEATNTLRFCISCHEMESTVYREYRTSVHFENPTGVQAICSDCHVPKEWTRKLVRKIKASKELFHWVAGSIDTAEKFEARRLDLASRVWQSMEDSDSQECRNCHSLEAMDLGFQGRFASAYHRRARDEDQTCIDCHKGISHHLPRDWGPEAAFTEPLAEDDREYAGEINDTCAGCHGEFGQGSADGEYPRLAGLYPAYLARQIKHFKTRERLNIPMLPYATERELPEEDVRIIASYLSSIELPTALPPIEGEFNAFERLQASKRVINVPRYPGDADSGRRLYRQECAGCHGTDAYGNRAGLVPQLAGQHSLYLKRQIGKFRDGQRLHGEGGDAEIFKAFSERETDDILAWLSLADD